MGKNFRAILWILGCGTLSYGLFKTVTPDEEYRKKIKRIYENHEKLPVEVQSKKQQILNVLQAAAESDKPLHSLSKEEREDLRKK